MSSGFNPYAPPASGETASRDGWSEAIREGNTMVVPVSGGRVPQRCVRCNAAASHRLSRRLYWHSPAYYLLILVSPIIYVIAALIVRKSARFDVWLCDQHRSRRRMGILIGWIGALASLVMGIVLLSSEPGLALGLFLAVLLFAMVGLAMANIVTPKRIDKERAWVRVGQPFLESL